MKLIIIESPFAGAVARNLDYLDRCIRDALSRGESPLASHKMFTTALNDNIPEQRALGIAAGLAWRAIPSVTPVFYVDYGMSGGMKAAREMYEKEGRNYLTRAIGINT